MDELVPAVQDAGCEWSSAPRIPIWSPLWKDWAGTNIHVVLRMFTSEKSGAFTGEIGADMLVDLGGVRHCGPL